MSEFRGLSRCIQTLPEPLHKKIPFQECSEIHSTHMETLHLLLLCFLKLFLSHRRSDDMLTMTRTASTISKLAARFSEFYHGLFSSEERAAPVTYFPANDVSIHQSIYQSPANIFLHSRASLARDLT